MEDSMMSSKTVADAAMRFADAVTSAEKSQLRLQAVTNQHLVDMKDTLQQIAANRNTQIENRDNGNDDDDNNNNSFDNQALIEAVEDLTKESKLIQACLGELKEDSESIKKSVQWLKTISRSIKNLEEDTKERAEKDAKIHAIEFAIQNVSLVSKGGDNCLVKYVGYPGNPGSVCSKSGASVLMDILFSFRQGRGHFVREYFLDPGNSHIGYSYYLNEDDIKEEWYEKFRELFHEKLHILLGKEPTFVPEEGMVYYEVPG